MNHTRIIFVTIGTIGDINPFLSIGLELQKKCKKISFITSSFYKNEIVKHNFDFICCQSVENYNKWLNDKITHIKRKSLESVVRHLMLDTMDAMFQALSKFKNEKILVIMHPLAVGAKIACDKYYFENIIYCLQPFALFSIYDSPLYPGFELFTFLPNLIRRLLMIAVNQFIINGKILPIINKFRLEKQCLLIQGNFINWIFSNNSKVIGLFPPWLKHIPMDWPYNFEAHGFVFLENNKDVELADCVKTFLLCNAELPVILVTLSSINILSYEHEIEITRIVVKKLGIKVIFLTHNNEIMNEDCDNELFITYTKHALLLPYVSMVINNGGIGTCAIALSHGVPQLIIPKLFDQPDNANNFVKLGVALKLSSKQYNVKNAFKVINILINSPQIKNQCKYYANKINSFASIQNITEIVYGVL